MFTSHKISQYFCIQTSWTPGRNGLQQVMFKKWKKHFSTELYLSSLFTAVVYHYKCSMNHPMKYNPMFFLHLMQHAASLKANNPSFFLDHPLRHTFLTRHAYSKKKKEKKTHVPQLQFEKFIRSVRVVHCVRQAKVTLDLESCQLTLFKSL